jgi:MFS family permease
VGVEWRFQFYASLFLTSLGLGMYLYFIPLFAQKFGATFLQLGFIGTAGALTYVLTPIIAGHFADKIGHMWFYGIALVMNTAATVLLLFSRSVYDIILLRAFGGVALAFLWPTAEVLVVDLTSEQNRMKEMGTFSVVWGFGYLIGPLLGGVTIPSLGFQTLFILSSLTIFLGFIQAAFGVLPHAKTEHKAEQRTSNPHRPFKFPEIGSSTWRLWPLYSLIALYGLIFSVVSAIFPGYANAVGVTVELIGILFAVFGISRIMIFATIQHYVRLGAVKVLTLVSMAISCGVFMIASFPVFSVFLLSSIILGVSFAVIFPISITLISHAFPNDRAGVAVGSYESFFVWDRL